MRFVLPLKREDLGVRPEEDPDGGQYWVRSVLSLRDLLTRLKQCELSVRQGGSAFVLDGGFDVIYSVLRHLHGREVGSDCKASAFFALERGLASLEKELDRVLAGEVHTLPATEKESWLTRTKMLVYLMCQMVELLESQDSSASAAPSLAGRGGRGGKKASSSTSSGSDSWSWTVERKQSAVTLLYKLFNLNLALLFDPPVVEEDLVNCVATALFRLLENPSVALQKGKDLRLSIFQILGNLCSRFGYTLSCRLKIVQSLRHFEHLSSALAEAVEMLSTQFNCPTLVMEVVRDISQVPPQELQRDTSGTRAYAAFLTDLAERLPEKVRPCLSLLMQHLDGESSTMRKAVLAILGEIVLRVLNGEQLDETSRDTRDQFLDCLEDHVHDVHAHVRSSVLQVWQRLCQSKAIPLSRQHRLLRLVIGRLQDRSSNVRKQSVQLLTALLQCNPFTASMSVDDLKEQLKKEKEALDKMMPSEEEERVKAMRMEEEWAKIEEELQEMGEEEEEGGEEVWENAAPAEVVSRLQHLLQKKKYSRAYSLLSSAKDNFADHPIFGAEIDEKSALKAAFLALTDAADEEMAASQSQEAGQEGEGVSTLEKQKVIVSYLTDSVNFAEQLGGALSTICTLLGSKQISDVLEAVNFFVSAFEFGFLQAMMGVRQMLNLVWSRETTVKEAVVLAYRRLYIDGGGAEEQRGGDARAHSIARNFMELVKGATVGELASMEELVCMLVTSGDMSKEVFQVLWSHFTKCGSDTSDEDSRSALVLLGMIATAEPAVITSNMSLLIKTGLTERGLEDLQLAHDTCVALTKIASVKKDIKEAPAKLDADHELFGSLRRIVVEGARDASTSFYIPAAQKALVVAYQFAEQPDVLCGGWLKEICRGVVRSRNESGGSGAGEDAANTKVDSLMTRRLVSVVGHLAVCQLNHLDVAILGELKRRKALRDEKKEAKPTPSSSKKGKKRKSSMGLRRQQTGGGEDDEMDCIGAEADDTEVEFVRKVCETEVVDSANLLSAFVPLVVHVCSNPSRYRDPSLRIAASLALAKLMLVSPDFCERHLQLLFTLMERSEEDALRGNLIVAAGDLSFRFPNVLEPWTPNMYARLRDPSPAVRSNTLTVLTHLILNDMIKVKGQISDMALCVSDESDKISGLARHFFSELARKGNALYNVMPDIISRLSSAEEEVTEDRFRKVMGHIVSLIEKDKHLESLVEKLCHRFRACPDSPRQWRDLSYCLSLFPFSDKAVRRLQDNFGCFSDKLHDEAVHQAFSGILVQARKTVKQETKALLDEMEEALEKAHLKCLEDHNAHVRADKARGGRGGAASGGGGRRKSGRKRRSRAGEEEDSEEEEEDKEEEEMELKLEEEDEEEEEAQEGEEGEEEEEGGSEEAKTPPRPQEEEDGGRRRRSSRRKATTTTEEEEEESAASAAARGGGQRLKRSARGKAAASEEEEEDPAAAAAAAAASSSKGRGGRAGRRQRVQEEEEEEERTQQLKRSSRKRK